MIINSQNYSCIDDLVHEWKEVVNKIGFQSHTPFSMEDPLWLPFGSLRNSIVDKLIEVKGKFPEFIINIQKQLELMRGNWGGTGTTPILCPSCAILS
jgi:hypothetical protein